MEGEAYFEVEHDRRAPFVVSTNGLDIEVLGTRFNIRNDDNEHRVTTVLLEGAVKAYASGREQASRCACTPRSSWFSTPGRTPCA